jgi:hypothetical protein
MEVGVALVALAHTSMLGVVDVVRVNEVVVYQ